MRGASSAAGSSNPVAKRATKAGKSRASLAQQSVAENLVELNVASEDAEDFEELVQVNLGDEPQSSEPAVEAPSHDSDGEDVATTGTKKSVSVDASAAAKYRLQPIVITFDSACDRFQ